MLVTLIGKNSLNKLILPSKPIGNYWLYDKNGETKQKLVNFESVDGHWQVVSNSYSSIIHKKNIEIHPNQIKIIGNNEIVDKVILQKHGIYFIKLAGSDEICLLYCSPLYENTFLHFTIKNTTEIRIGRDKKKSDIFYDRVLVKKQHARLYYKDNAWFIENYDKNFNTYVNDNPVSNQSRQLSNGDTVFILGLKIIIMGKDLFINNPLGKIKLKRKFFETSTEGKQKIEKMEDEENILDANDEKYFLRPPRMLDVLEEKNIAIESPEKEQNNRDMPILLAMGSIISLGVMSFISIIQTLDDFIHRTSKQKKCYF